MSILITGAAGFIGSHVAQLLAAQTTSSLVCLDNFNDDYDPQRKRRNAEALQALPRVSVVEGDFCDHGRMQRLFAEREVTKVIHLGAYAGVRASVTHPKIFQEVNIGGTLALLEAARQHAVERFLLISSSTVYGTGAAVPFTEDAPLGVPASPYGVTKRAAELFGLTYAALHSVPVVCLRPFSVYGPRLRPDLALSIFANAIDTGGTLPLFGDGTLRRDYTHVSDICRGLLSALTAQDVVGEVINLGQSAPVEMREVIRLLEQFLGKSAHIDWLPARPEDLPITFANVDKAQRLLGYVPQVSLAEGIEEFCHWYRQQAR